MNAFRSVETEEAVGRRLGIEEVGLGGNARRRRRRVGGEGIGVVREEVGRPGDDAAGKGDRAVLEGDYEDEDERV